MMSPTGKNMAEMVRISPGAFSWYQGAASVDSITAQLLRYLAAQCCVDRITASGTNGGFESKMQAKSKPVDLPKSQQGTGHERIPEQFVPSHMRLLAPYPRHQFDGLLRSEGVHGFCTRQTIAQKELLTVVDRDGNARQTSSGQEGKRCTLYMQDDITAGIRRPVRPRGSLLRRGSHGHLQHSHFMLFLIGVLVHAQSARNKRDDLGAHRGICQH